MPEELVVIALLSIMCGTGVIIAISKMIVGYLRDKNVGAPDGASLTESQLRRLVQEAVEDAVAPLLAQLEAQEERDRPLLEEPTTRQAAGLLADERESDPAPAARRQRA